MLPLPTPLFSFLSSSFAAGVLSARDTGELLAFRNHCRGGDTGGWGGGIGYWCWWRRLVLEEGE